MLKKILSVTIAAFMLSSLASCSLQTNNKAETESSAREESRIDDETTAQAPLGSGAVIWDFYLDESDKIDYDIIEAAITIDGIPGVEFKYSKSTYEILANGESLIDKFGPPFSFYVYDFTGDGIPELCFGESWCSGIVSNGVSVFDYAADKWIYTISDRPFHDYYLFLRSGELCIRETENMEEDAIRTGTFSYDKESESLQVIWDSEPNYNPDPLTGGNAAE